MRKQISKFNKKINFLNIVSITSKWSEFAYTLIAKILISFKCSGSNNHILTFKSCVILKNRILLMCVFVNLFRNSVSRNSHGF